MRLALGSGLSRKRIAQDLGIESSTLEAGIRDAPEPCPDQSKRLQNPQDQRNWAASLFLSSNQRRKNEITQKHPKPDGSSNPPFSCDAVLYVKQEERPVSIERWRF
ncbi:hypothetical protein JK185_03915 [Gluconobacter wancherniae]|uniref:hypothetical protein n=1 Tax=Gluconobacter wancherniae TaxID=1307955 RepID=UPI001B8CA26C|nr:hypothetical protein [Gluconobacter wancherniae]MBS1062198.1 hypothetical protein [Gluconobacter wancherniae]